MPFLILFATILFTAQPLFTRFSAWAARSMSRLVLARDRFQTLVSIYGGYFAGIGILMRPLSESSVRDIHEMNAVKNAPRSHQHRGSLLCRQASSIGRRPGFCRWRNRRRIFHAPIFTELPQRECAPASPAWANHQRRDVLQTTARVIPNKGYFFFFSGLTFSTTQVFACSNSVLNPFAKSCVPYSKSTTKQKVKKTKRTSQNSPRMSDMSRTVP